ncbi:MAG: N-acetyltransferase [Candidatus Omnitrophica bacterium]|nr:N-acetyltransferase [Candidatus Omnitrophota bacterium]
MKRQQKTVIRKARISDAVKIHKLVQYYAKEDLMLARSLMDIYENIRDYFVAEKARAIIGCCALHICWKDLGEVKALAVNPVYRKKGIGKDLVEKAMDEAARIKLKKVFCLTYIPKFFRKFGFRKIEKRYLPHKIWNECINCPKFPNCDEVPMIKKIKKTDVRENKLIGEINNQQ